MYELSKPFTWRLLTGTVVQVADQGEDLTKAEIHFSSDYTLKLMWTRAAFERGCRELESTDEYVAAMRSAAAKIRESGEGD